MGTLHQVIGWWPAKCLEEVFELVWSGEDVGNIC